MVIAAAPAADRSALPNPQPKLALAVACGAVLAAATLALMPSRSLSVTQQFWAAAIIVIGLAPTSLYLWRPRFVVPLVPLHGLFYALSFGVGSFADKLSWRNVPAEAITEALMYTAAGLCTLYGTYGVSGILFRPAPNPLRISGRLTVAQVRVLAWTMVAVHSLAFFVDLQDIPSLAHMVLPAGFVGFGLLLWLLWSNQLGAISKTGLYLIVAPTMLTDGLTSGSVAPTALLIVFASLVYWNCRRKIPWLLVLVAFITVPILFPVRSMYRNYTWWGPYRNAGVVERITLYADIALDRIAGAFDDKGGYDTGRAVINRLSHAPTLAWVIRATPEEVPYWEGATLRPLLTSVIPRFVYPDKPTSGFANEFGRRYHLLPQSDHLTTFNLPWIVEFYANFGVVGIFLGMAACGVLFRILLEKLAVPQAGIIEYILGLTVTFHLFYAESNFALMWGGIILTLTTFSVGVVIILWASRRLGTMRPPRGSTLAAKTSA